MEAAKDENVTYKTPENAKEIAGHGSVITIDNSEILAGNKKLMAQYHVTGDYPETTSYGTEVFLAKDGVLIGAIVIADTLKDDAKSAIASLKAQNLHTVMLTGDSETTANAIAKETGIDALAISFGSSHGNYPEGYVPEFDFERLKEIKEKTKMPLVLHGGSGSGDENIKRCVEFGINKINVGCDFMNANVDSIKQHLKKDPDINYWVMMHQVEIDSQELVKKYIHLSGSEGKSL